MTGIHEEYEQLPTTEEMVFAEKRLAEKNQKLYNTIRLDIELALRDRNTKVLIREIFKFCGMYNSSEVSGDYCLHAEGRRFVGVQLKALLDSIDTKLYYKLMSEGVEYEEAIYKSS